MSSLKLRPGKMKRALFAAVVALVLIGVTWLLFGQLWPEYDFAREARSPSGQHVAVIIRGNKAAFDDFFYRVYVFPRGTAPQHLKSGERVWIRGRWSDRSYLVYEGYSVPAVRWTSQHEIEIDVNDLYDQVSEFYPTPSLHEPRRDRSSAILASLLMNRSDPRNIVP